MKRWIHSLARAGILVFLLTLLGVWSPSTYAASRQLADISGSITLSITNGATFQYDDFPGPRFHLVLMLSAPWSGPNTQFTAQIKLDNGQQLVANFTGPAAGGTTSTADATGDRDNSGNLFAVGAHTATATLTNPATSTPITSNQVSFTITKRWMSFSCGTGRIFLPGQAAHATLSAQSLDSNLPLDWTQGTATVWLVGPSTVTYSNLLPDSTGVVSITTPAQTGNYALNCSFSGTTYYAPEQVTTTNTGVLISEMRQLGGIQLYTTPQTLEANQTTQMLVVFTAAPGQPTPTGEFNITLGTYGVVYTKGITIGPNGTASFTAEPISGLYGATAITVHYSGDPTYNDQSVNFPLTNPAIPGSGSRGGGGGGGGGGGAAPKQAAATATKPATATPTSNIISGATANANAAPPSTTQLTGGNSQSRTSAGLLAGGGLLALLIAIALLVLGAAGVYVLWRRRMHTLYSGSPAPPGAYLPETVPTEPVPSHEPSVLRWPPEQASPRQ